MARYIARSASWVFDRLVREGEEFEVGDEVSPAKCWERIDEPQRRRRKGSDSGEDTETV